MSNKSGILSMCRKAGKLVMGMDMVKEACNVREAKAVFAASDLSPKSLKEVKYFCNKNNVKLFALDMTMDEVGFGLGKRVGIIAVTDGGFAKSCQKDLELIEIDENEFY